MSDSGKSATILVINNKSSTISEEDDDNYELVLMDGVIIGLFSLLIISYLRSK